MGEPLVPQGLQVRVLEHFSAHQLSCAFLKRWRGKSLALCMQLISDLAWIRPLPPRVFLINKTLDRAQKLLLIVRRLLAAHNEFTVTHVRATSIGATIGNTTLTIDCRSVSSAVQAPAGCWLYIDDFAFAHPDHLAHFMGLYPTVVRAIGLPKRAPGATTYIEHLQEDVWGSADDPAFAQRALDSNPFTTLNPLVVPLVLSE